VLKQLLGFAFDDALPICSLRNRYGLSHLSDLDYYYYHYPFTKRGLPDDREQAACMHAAREVHRIGSHHDAYTYHNYGGSIAKDWRKVFVDVHSEVNGDRQDPRTRLVQGQHDVQQHRCQWNHYEHGAHEIHGDCNFARCLCQETTTLQRRCLIAERDHLSSSRIAESFAKAALTGVKYREPPRYDGVVLQGPRFYLVRECVPVTLHGFVQPSKLRKMRKSTELL